MTRFKGRAARACYYCRSQKVKCSGEQPCVKCVSSGKNCVFSSHERVVTVPENYIRRLESEIVQLRDSQAFVTLTTPSTSHGTQEQALPRRIIENSTTEHFVHRLKGVYSNRLQSRLGQSPLPTPSTTSATQIHDSDVHSTVSNYTYVPLDYDSSRPKVLVKLPPHSYALYLLGQFETFMGFNYHWYLKKRFRAWIDGMYDPSPSWEIDRTWLGCFSVVLALGESYNDSAVPSFVIGNRSGFSTYDAPSTDCDKVDPPGIELFKQALLLLPPSYEEPTLEQVEALNLITFYCYSLNRRKTAYSYSGQALRLGQLLGLSKPQTNLSPLEQEHRKRIWWTTVCMDMMTSTELSLSPTDVFQDDSIGFPESSQLSAQDAQEFSDPQYLTAHVRLCRIKYQIIKTVSELRVGNAVETQAHIEPCLLALNNWRLGFSPTLEFTEAGTFSDNILLFPPMRTIASLLLRYNQCIILLLRPLLLKQLHELVHNPDSLMMTSNDFVALNTQCLQAAAHSTSILFALSRCHKIAKFGFWESLHIFSSLTVRVMADCLMDKSPTAFTCTWPNAPYQSVKGLLEEMARLGNAASKDHVKMIHGIEDLFRDTPSNPGLTEGMGDMVDLSEYMNAEHMTFDLDETFASFCWS